MTDAASSFDPDLFPLSWQRAWGSSGAQGHGEALRDALLQAYAEPQRHYHTQQHLAECLAMLAPLRGLADYPAEVELALWFHDAVYDTHRHDNELRSADWAREALADAGAPPEAAARVHTLVMATRHAVMPEGRDAQLLVDVDLSILAAGPARFAEYEQQIRDEYAFVPGFLFRRKRREVLQGFLDRPHIFSTPHFQAAHEAAARANLQRALQALG